MHTILLALVAGCGFALAGMLGLFGVSVNRVARLASVAIAAGILLAITFADLMPDALVRAGRTRTAFGFMVGFIILFLMESLSGAHVHHHGMDDEHLHHHSLDHHHKVRPFTLGLGVHNLTDGLAIGMTTVLSKATAAAVTTGVLVHQLPVGISFAAVLGSLNVSRAKTMRLAIVCAAMIPLGALMILALPAMSNHVLGTLVAGAGGALCYVACGHLLPEAQSERHAIVAPVFVIARPSPKRWGWVVIVGVLGAWVCG